MSIVRSGIPGIFIQGRKFYIINDIRDKHWHLNSSPLELNKWVNLKVTQRLEEGKYIFRVHMDGSLLENITNNKAVEMKQVDVWATNNWNEAQPGFIKNILISSKC